MQKPIISDSRTGSDDGRSGPSKMAERIAMVRAGESKKPEDERICYDPYATRFIRPEVVAFYQHNPEKYREEMEQIERMMPGLNNTLAARARYFDDVVGSAVDEGIGQLVILGAGYDTRAYRIEGMKKIRVFEVDHPDTSIVKKEKVKEIFGSLPGHVAYVPLDLESDGFGERLKRDGYDTSVKTLFLMEGVIMYLPLDALDRILKFIAHNSAIGSYVLFDYTPAMPQIRAGMDGKTAANAFNFAKERGETIKSGIMGPVDEFLSKRGFTLIKNMNSQDYKKAYFHGKNSDRQVSGLLSFAYAAVE